MRPLLTMTVGDLRQRVRDRSVLIMGVLVPVALMFVMNLVFSGSDAPELGAVTVAAAAPADDELATVLLATLEEVEDFEVSVEEVAPEEVRALAEAGEAALGIVVPEGFGAAVAAGEPVTVDLVEGDGAGLETDVLALVVRAVTEQMTAGTVATQAAAELGLGEEAVGAVGQQVAQAPPAVSTVEGTTATEQLNPAATTVAGQAGLFLLFTVGFGVLALVNEREQGTLARLRSMPMRPGLIVGAKALSSYVLGVAATLVLLTAGTLLFEVDFGSEPVVLVLVLSVVAAATSLMFVVARVARTAEQAGVAQAILAVVLGMAGGAFFPIAAGGVAATLLDLNPVAAFTRALGITAGGGGLADVAGPVAMMLAFAAVCALLSRLVPDRGVTA
ncbi:ABC-2 type transport system permease protein [Georgenia satyanarayanai]|uniref:ABC-2 type transport system permease protein n=1 Tax=Georgenia satyanarayanai TaxID=860221 RepID=A0A2Y9A2Y8_9MICO|nr:ABC transporter permease [Georgenia satyanarayanai]PYG01727.1 ABC-2 type transport system permease protein [Georgenia satyanarayanai]SSA36527.1 ABC-2 type transport system permease protein [Georgenia satyanarayanai]